MTDHNHAEYAKTWGELLDRNPPAPSLRGAEDLVIGSSRSEPGSMTRLEAAEQERRALIIAEHERFKRSMNLELELHQRNLDNITRTFGLRLSVA